MADVWIEDDEPVYDLIDPASGKPRMCSRECATCIFDAQSPVTRSLRSGRLKGLIDSARASESYVICHSTFNAGPAVCRGFADRYSTNALRVFGRIGGFIEIEPPSKAVSDG